MPNCSGCGVELSPDANFCPECGTSREVGPVWPLRVSAAIAFGIGVLLVIQIMKWVNRR